ncbi:MAG: patatin-like phospholipase family protein [Planctomycetota bacterium]
MSENASGRPQDQAIAREVPLKRERFSTIERMVRNDDYRVVLSLGGGALPGLAGNIALLRILEELDLKPHIEEVWGTSAGAVVGGGWAAGTPAYDILDLVASLAEKGSVDANPLKFALSILASCKPLKRPLPDGVVAGKAFRKKIAGGLRVDRIEDCPTPFRAVACTDDGMGRTKVFRKGPMMPAIYSSMAIPGVMASYPGDDDGNTYFDGGLVEKTPLKSVIADHSRSSDQRKLLILASHFQNEAREKSTGLVKRFLATIYVLEELIWDYQIKEARERDDVTVTMLDPHLSGFSLFAFDKTVDAYLESRDAFANSIQNTSIVASLGGML